ncbi:MAG: histidine kinase [Bacteroidetes bacterium]|nr:histidine kinase [Bacteroidota bacterium]
MTTITLWLISYICNIIHPVKYLILLLFLQLTVKSQDPQFTHLDKSSGLPSNSIYNIFQDSKGFMWFSCDKGLVKYDGFEFITYSNKLQSSKSGTNIQEDKYGRIWYQNFDGYVFYIENDSLHLLKQNTPIGYFNYGIIDDHLFIIQSNGIDVYDIKTLRIQKHIRINTKKIAGTISNHTNYYVYNDTVLHVLNKKLEDHPVKIPEELNANGYSYLMSSDQNIIFYSRNTIPLKHCFTILHHTISPTIPIALNNIQSASFTHDSYWFCTANGAYQIDKHGAPVNGTIPYFKDYNISYVYKDRENNFWFSTLNNGLLFVPDLKTTQHFTSINPIKSVLINNDLYVGAGEGKLYKVNLTDKTIHEIYKSPYNKEISTLYYDSIHKNTIISNNEIEILDDHLKNTWHNVGALKDLKLIDSNYYAFAMSGTCALYKLNVKKHDKWTDLYNKYRSTNIPYSRFILGSRAKSIEYDSQQSTIYFGTSHGLQAITPTNIREIKIDTATLYINKLCRYQHVIYGLSSGGDIIQITKSTTRYLHLPSLEKNEVVMFIKICDHYLFLTTHQNLYSIDLSEPNISLHLQHKINYDITDIQLWKQQLIIITKNGIITESLNTIGHQDVKPLFYINTFLANSKPIDISGSPDLSYTQNNIEINYSILSFKTDFNFPLYYKINESPWEKAGNQTRTLKLSALSPGDYKITFRLGETSHAKFKETTLRFSIKKAYWQTWWFISIWILLFVLSIIIVAKWRINELKHKNKLLNEKIENEQKYYKTSLKAIKAQMNPHFFYNALNTIQSFIYSEDKKNASTYLSKFSKLTRLILEMSEKDQVTLSEEISTLQLYLDIEKVRFNDDFEFSIQMFNHTSINPDFVMFPPMLIQPYVENAIKHGLLHKKGKKELHITFEIKHQLLHVTIDDNGIGRKLSEEINFKKSHQHTSFSTNANEQRFKILSLKNALASVQITDKFDSFDHSSGTTVNLIIPVTLTQK